ncbi:hypothetical protein [Mycobacterium sp. 852014-52450_SCH5900713]|nr:hypothetical protein [Mycobacterium sp. 852014-52450_SCH5900713]
MALRSLQEIARSSAEETERALKVLSERLSANAQNGGDDGD